MKKHIHILYICLIATIAFSSCQKKYKVVSIESSPITINAEFDAEHDPEIMAMLDVYKKQIDSIMNRKLAESEMSMSNGTPQSLLANLTADILRESAVGAIGKPADFAVMNNGGLRTSLPQGDITVGDIFKIYPFENEVFYLKLKGSDVVSLFESLAKRGGEGVSGCAMVMKDRKLESLKLNGASVDPDSYYWCATIDYLAEGNSGMQALRNAVETVDTDILLRDLMMEAVKSINDNNRKVTSRIDGRIVVVD